jgi:hypothetical protein
MVPVPEGKGEFEVAVKATDASYNTQVCEPRGEWLLTPGCLAISGLVSVTNRQRSESK